MGYWGSSTAGPDVTRNGEIEGVLRLAHWTIFGLAMIGASLLVGAFLI